MDTINIGLLLPSSTIFPVGKDFEKGLKEGLTPLRNAGVEVEIAKEFVSNGDTKLNESAINKFFNYDDVDLVTGIISNNVVREMADKFREPQKPLLVNNLGAHIPAIDRLNECVFFNSPHLWQHAYALGHWGVSTFGKKGMYISSVYDAGYSFSHMFHEGMMAADPTAQWSFSVPPMPPPGQLSNMDVIFPFLEQYQPDFIFATFCGGETSLFLNEFVARGWHHKTKVLGLPYLLSPFAPLNADITIYTTQLFSNAPQLLPSKAFYHLGLQTGQNITNAALKATTNSDLWLQIHSQLNTSNMFHTGQQHSDTTPVTILQNDIKAGETTFTTKPLTQQRAFDLDVEKMRPLTTGIAAGWNNPYLCI
ncbi:MAG: ABC transporter substrate-binding protein [Mucilaginibacter sp.]|uniref:ABC transporter substrate-binding protein n=1 Tax=Mucilaginibacter sp. TaxID=1882438 RepID=UPI0032657D53